MRRLLSVMQTCGSLCQTDRATQRGPFAELGKHYFNATTSLPVNCRGLYENSDMDAPRESADAPEHIPSELLRYYTMDGRVRIKKEYHNQRYLANETRTLVWTKQLIEEQMEQARNRTLRGTYGVRQTSGLLDVLRKVRLTGARVLVVGSERPWVEVLALVAGASEVVTLEYSEISVRDVPQLTAVTPSEFAKLYLAGEVAPFDVVVSFSSFEHSGLARYGDALNPWGDIISVAKAWCVTKPKGTMVIEVPYNADEDSIFFNAHRVYGPVRTGYLMTNWAQKYPDASPLTKARVYERRE